jgi:hypothetical protein
MKIKKFTQFISENEHYSSINEGDIVPGVPYNTGYEMTDKDTNKMSVDTGNGKSTSISFQRDFGGQRVSLIFEPTNEPLTLKQGASYAYVVINKEKEERFPVAVTKIDGFVAEKSGRIYDNANSIDLLGEFIATSGISSDAASGIKLAKVIAELSLNMKYNIMVTDTFKKFANNIIMNVRNGKFVPTMTQDLVSYKSDPGMKSFVAELPKSCDTLKPPKKA